MSNLTNADWSHEKVEKLINLYKNKPELWNPQDNNYHVKNFKIAAWASIASEMGCQVDVVKSKIASLMSSYRREKGKVRKFGIYRSCWFAYKYFDFMEDRHKHKSSSDNDYSLKQENFTDDEYQEDTTLIEPNASEIVKVEMHGDADNSRPCDPQQSQMYYSSELKRRRIDDCFTELHEDCSIFAEYITCKMRQFSKLERAVLQHKINNIIFEAELKKLQLEEQNRQNNVESSMNSFSSHNGTPEHHVSSGNEFN